MTTDHFRKSLSPSSSSSSSSTFCPFLGINHDHLISILQLLPVESILSFSMTCKKFRYLGSSDLLWECICRREWGIPQLNSLVGSLPDRKRISWKRLFQQVSTVGSLSCSRLFTRDGIFPEPRASHSLNWVGDYLVLFGGGCQGGKHLDDIWVAHVGSSSSNNNNKVKKTAVEWQQLTDTTNTPTGRFGHTCIAVGDRLILFGGINDEGIRQNDTWIGHLLAGNATLRWNPLPAGGTSPYPRGAHAGCGVGDDRMVIHGGIGLNGVRLSDAWVLDFSSDGGGYRWRLVASGGVGPSPPARSGHSLTWIGGNRMVLLGGRGVGYDVLDDLWILELGESENFLDSKWTRIVYDSSSSALILPPRVGHSAAFVVGGKVLVFGGEDSQRQRMDDFWVLDTKAGRKGVAWRRLKAEGERPECRSFHTVCADRSGRSFYVFGGMVDAFAGLRFDGGLYLVELLFEV